jgi:hypothetical protein
MMREEPEQFDFDIVGVALVRLGSVTHSINTNQRFIGIERDDFTGGDGTWNLTAPGDPRHCPPGHYLLFAINQLGVPSIGQIVRIIPSDAPEIVMISPANGGFVEPGALQVVRDLGRDPREAGENPAIGVFEVGGGVDDALGYGPGERSEVREVHELAQYAVALLLYGVGASHLSSVFTTSTQAATGQTSAHSAQPVHLSSRTMRGEP